MTCIKILINAIFTHLILSPNQAYKSPLNIKHTWGVYNTLKFYDTCGTHLGETKLVDSIDGKPVSESMSISLIFVSVGTIFCKKNK